MHAQKIVVLLQAERAFLHFELKTSERKILTLLEKLRLAHRIETNLVEEAQQPRLAVTEIARLPPRIPHLQHAADELVSTRSFHTVHTEIRAADADCVFRRPGARWIVFGGDE